MIEDDMICDKTKQTSKITVCDKTKIRLWNTSINLSMNP